MSTVYRYKNLDDNMIRQMIGLIDTHFHLDMYWDYLKKYEYINEAGQYTLCMTNSTSVFLSCKNMFRDSKYVKFALGLHPMSEKMKESDLFF